MAKRGMMDQFFDIKEEHPDTILFFRMGEFYELFHEDAVVAAEVLGLALTSRYKNSENPIPMAGFPWHGLEDHLRTMLRAGHKVTVAEQEENLREGAKLLERVVPAYLPQGACMKRGFLRAKNAPYSLRLYWTTPALASASSMHLRAKHGPAATRGLIASFV